MKVTQTSPVLHVDLPDQEKMALLMIATHADNKDEARLSLSYLAKILRKSERTTTRLLEKLEKKKFIFSNRQYILPGERLSFTLRMDTIQPQKDVTFDAQRMTNLTPLPVQKGVIRDTIRASNLTEKGVKFDAPVTLANVNKNVENETNTPNVVLVAENKFSAPPQVHDFPTKASDETPKASMSVQERPAEHERPDIPACEINHNTENAEQEAALDTEPFAFQAQLLPTAPKPRKQTKNDIQADHQFVTAFQDFIGYPIADWGIARRHAKAILAAGLTVDDISDLYQFCKKWAEGVDLGLMRSQCNKFLDARRRPQEPTRKRTDVFREIDTAFNEYRRNAGKTSDDHGDVIEAEWSETNER